MRAFRLAYDGRRFHGFQRQPDVPTVEDGLLDAVRALGLVDADDDADAADDDDATTATAAVPPGYAAAGRTDAGVSALCQTVAFDCPDWCSPGALNGELPAGVRAWAAADVPDDFHATHDATRRVYTYHLYAPPAGPGADRGDGDAGATTDVSGVGPLDSPAVRGTVPGVDDGRVAAALERLSGTHDFHNLTPDDRGTTREVDAGAVRDGDVLVVRVAGPGFARELVRRLVSLIRAVGGGERDPAFVDRVLAAAPLPGPEGVAPAAPEPLVLTRVDYPDVAFDPDPDAVAAARATFAGRAREALGSARATGQLADGIGRGG